LQIENNKESLMPTIGVASGHQVLQRVSTPVGFVRFFVPGSSTANKIFNYVVDEANAHVYANIKGGEKSQLYK
jgi:hypothetical protein